MFNQWIFVTKKMDFYHTFYSQTDLTHMWS